MIQYKDKNYPTRTFRVLFEGIEYDYTIATDTLSEAFEVDEAGELLPYEEEIDNQIYFYVPDDVLLLSAHVICAEHLDEPMAFLEEIFD